ncbi:MAG: DUF3524 domain-containing protein [Phycisphaerales bacterium]|jgi:glycosyltransferase involved in cell wall biosynthesis
MRILALEPYYGGSHQAFLDGWSKLSRHDWTILTLPAYKWKWRMRHAAITFAHDVNERIQSGQSWDVIFCSDMLNLAEFLGLVSDPVKNLNAVAYFHENQLTYPVRFEDERDYQFAMTNLTTALAAKSVWFNSVYHRDSFLEALAAFLNKMPDYQPTDTVRQIKLKSLIHPPGIEPFPARTETKPGPVRILWSARWEHDKNPEDFFEAVKIIKDRGIVFRLGVIGQQFRDTPQVFDRAKNYFADHIDHWGYQQKTDYKTALQQADIIVSTANHEFFGLSVAESVSAGAYPLLPKRLSYPEILQLDKNPEYEEFFYDGTIDDLAAKLEMLINRIEKADLWQNGPNKAKKITQRFEWSNLTPLLDDAIQAATTYAL